MPPKSHHSLLLFVLTRLTGTPKKQQQKRAVQAWYELTMDADINNNRAQSWISVSLVLELKSVRKRVLIVLKISHLLYCTSSTAKLVLKFLYINIFFFYIRMYHRFFLPYTLIYPKLIITPSLNCVVQYVVYLTGHIVYIAFLYTFYPIQGRYIS